MKKNNGVEVCLIHFSDGMKKVKLAGPFESERDAEKYIEEISSVIYLKPGQQFGIREIVTFDEYVEVERG